MTQIFQNRVFSVSWETDVAGAVFEATTGLLAGLPWNKSRSQQRKDMKLHPTQMQHPQLQATINHSQAVYEEWQSTGNGNSIGTTTSP